MTYNTVFTPFHYRNTKRIRRIFVSLGVILWIGATVAALGPILPHVLYRLSPGVPQTLAATISTTVPKDNSFIPISPCPGGEARNAEGVCPSSLAPLDPNLPEKNKLIIDKIGVNGTIHEGTDWEEILHQGVWRTPDWGTPELTSRPIILASHRWGYLDWSNAFRKQNSFLNLPKLEPGDTVDIVWNQRLYTYEIYAQDSGEQISDFDADLILYTCQLWNSPIRIFLYARLTSSP